MIALNKLVSFASSANIFEMVPDRHVVTIIPR